MLFREKLPAWPSRYFASMGSFDYVAFRFAKGKFAQDDNLGMGFSCKRVFQRREHATRIVPLTTRW
jgi:hypothetical protein